MAQVKFADTVQKCAYLCASDMRSLCPKEWSNAASSHLRLLAITEDARLIGGSKT